MKKMKLKESTNEYIKNIKKRMECTEGFAGIFFLGCMGINYFTIKSEAVAVILLFMIVLTKIVIYRETKKYVKHI